MFSERIRGLRKSKKLTQEQLAALVGVERSTIGKWESTSIIPSSDMLIELSDFFNVSIDYLLGNTDNPANNKIHRIKVYGSVPAGIPLEAIENIIGWEEISMDLVRDGSEYIALKVKGNSMNPKYLDYELKATKPKTRTSRREIPVPDILKPELKKLKKLATEEKLKLGALYNENTLLFPSQTGTYIDAKNLQRSWKRALERYNIPYRKFHALRHTYATALFEKGVNIVTVSKLLGHSTVKTTEIYTHVLENIKKEEVQVLNEFFA